MVSEQFLNAYEELSVKTFDLFRSGCEQRIKRMTEASFQAWLNPNDLRAEEEAIVIITQRIKEINDAPAAFREQNREMFSDVLSAMYQKIRIFPGSQKKITAKTKWVRIPYIQEGIRQGMKEAGTFLIDINLASEYSTNDLLKSAICIFRPPEDMKMLLAAGFDEECIHPHIQGGKACWSDYAAVIKNFLVTCDFTLLLLHIYNFLSSVNFNSCWHKDKFLSWPEVERNEPNAELDRVVEAINGKVEVGLENID